MRELEHVEMKLNFWQWLGIIIVVIALIFIIRREAGERGRAPNPAPEFSSQPATEVPSTATPPAVDPTTGPAAP